MSPFDAESVAGYPAIIGPPGKPTMRQITAIVAERYGISLEDLKGPSRERRFVYPRQEAFALIRAQGRQSLPQIGAYFGGRDHSTVLHGIRAHKARMAAAMGIAAE